MFIKNNPELEQVREKFVLDLMIPVVTMVHRMLNVREHIIQYFDDVRII